MIKKLEIISWLIILLINLSHGKSSRAHCSFGDSISSVTIILYTAISAKCMKSPWVFYIVNSIHTIYWLNFTSMSWTYCLWSPSVVGVRFKKLARLEKDDTKERDDVELNRLCSGAVQREEKLVKILIVAIKGYRLSFPTCLGDKVSINTDPCERSVLLRGGLLPHGPVDFGVKPASSG